MVMVKPTLDDLMAALPADAPLLEALEAFSPIMGCLAVNVGKVVAAGLRNLAVVPFAFERYGQPCCNFQA
jgi:hypothetical protein